jgi:hypothetical protein
LALEGAAADVADTSKRKRSGSKTAVDDDVKSDAEAKDSAVLAE